MNFFDQSYIINLPERIDRRRKMKQELKMLGLVEPSRVAFFSAIKPADKGDFPGLGARGCFLSHLAVLREAERKNLDNVLIMEDDLLFTRFLIQQQDEIVNELQQLNWDIAYLGHGENLVGSTKGVFQIYSQPLILAHFVAFNRKAIAQMVDALEAVLSRPPGHPDGGPMHVDGAYSTFRMQHPEITTLIANPSLGTQRSSPSNITGYKWFETAPVLAQLVGVARSVKDLQKRKTFT
ncbi:MAG: glycosyltransferase family 25 protein [Leptolyngbyaceae cyanobacterium SM1_3_5]|nr:glycosyltransferase family 25 protein [Leptolyngbyaceae cyanobacterium SM1_3_5]